MAVRRSISIKSHLFRQLFMEYRFFTAINRKIMIQWCKYNSLLLSLQQWPYKHRTDQYLSVIFPEQSDWTKSISMMTVNTIVLSFTQTTLQPTDDRMVIFING